MPLELPEVRIGIDHSSPRSSDVAEASHSAEDHPSEQPAEKADSNTNPKPKGRKIAGMKKRPQPKVNSSKVAVAVEQGERDVYTLREHLLIIYKVPAVPVPGPSVKKAKANPRIQPDNALGLVEESYTAARVVPKPAKMTIKVPACVKSPLWMSRSTNDRSRHPERRNRRQQSKVRTIRVVHRLNPLPRAFAPERMVNKTIPRFRRYLKG